MRGQTAATYHWAMELATFLRIRRQNLPPETGALGSWDRLPVRRGRRITQEEIAEAVGISRNWYRRLECGDARRASAKLLDRLAQAFSLSAEERMKLFMLGIPEMAHAEA